MDVDCAALVSVWQPLGRLMSIRGHLSADMMIKDNRERRAQTVLNSYPIKKREA